MMKRKSKSKKINFNTEAEQHKTYQPTSSKIWTIKLCSELLGTIFLTWMIGLLGVTFGGIKFEYLINGSDSHASAMLIGLWVGIDIFICLAIFSRWSCDLNPAVTTYRMISKGDSIKYGFSKIGIQIIGGLLAGLLIVLTQKIVHASTHNSADAIGSLKSSWSAFWANDLKNIAHENTFKRYAIAFIGELLGTGILIWAVFTKAIKNHTIKDVVIVGVIIFVLPTFIPLSTVGWNPARVLGTNFVYDIFKHTNGKSMLMFVVYAFSEILAVFIIFGLQKLSKKYFEPNWVTFTSLGGFKEITKNRRKKRKNKNKFF